MLSAVIPSAHSYPAMPLARQQDHQGCVHPGPLVLGTGPLNSPSPTEDRDQTVSRRFKPSSRTTLNGEQPYPWDLLQPQDVMSRHRGAKPHRRCELLDAISLLSRRTFYPMSDGPSIRDHRITNANFVPVRDVSLTVKLPYAFALSAWFPIRLREPLHASVTL